MKFSGLDSRELSKMGFTFKTDEEIESFLRIVNEELNLRIRKALLDIVSPEQLKELESCETDFEVRTWFRQNCIEYFGLPVEKEIELKQEIEKNRSRIPGAILTIEVLNLSVRSYNCLKRAGLDTVDKVVAFNESDDLSKIHNLRWKNVEEVQEKLREFYG